jgi:ABC-type phosphate transport system, periplasmic component
MRTIKAILGLSICITLVCSCNTQSGPNYTDTPTYGQIKIASDETLQPICDYEIQVFEGIYKYAKIDPVYVPEKEAFRLLLADSIRFILATRKLSKSEEDFFASKKIYPRQREIARDAIAILLHPSNKDSILNVETIKNILTGKIQTWQQLNKKSKLGKIQVVFDNQSSSTVRYVLDSITKGAPLSPNLSATELNKDVVDYVSRNTNALGIIGVSWVSDKTDSTSLSFLKKVQVALLTNEKIATYENSNKPYQAMIAKKLYPLTRSIFAVNAEPRQGLASGFAAFVASYRGQLIILKSGLLPATQQVTIRSVQISNDL